MRDEIRARRTFIALLTAVTVIKCIVAAQLPLFVDEAFYWQEGQHLAPAYSDLPGLTAWLTRLGVELGGQHALALRAPFLLIAALVPCLIANIAMREFGAARGWQAGMLALLLPLSGTLGLLALPDVPMALATVLCMDAGARLLRQVDAKAAAELAMGLMIGALSHYRFAAVIGVGLVALLMLPEGRRALRDLRVWMAIVIGAVAWVPLLFWNLENADAGLRFQLIDRHPWALHWDGAWFVLIQALLVTPLLLVAMMVAARRNLFATAGPASRYFAMLGAATVLGFFALGFFADSERVSFHWPLAGYLALLPLVPVVLATWRVWLRRVTWATAAIGLVSVLGYYTTVSTPSLRARFAAEKWYPSNFVGWGEVAAATHDRLAMMPPHTRIVADNFKLAAEVGFALDNPRIDVLDHPLNHRHGRAPQLRLWGLESAGRSDWDSQPVLLIVGVGEVRYRDLLQHYHDLCSKVGPLPAPSVVNVDHGAQRFLLFALDKPASGACSTPAMAYINPPESGARVTRQFNVSGWAFRDGVGLRAVDVTLDGKVVAQADYGRVYTGAAIYWKVSNDPNHPRVGFDARVDAGDVAPGRHWLGLRLHGNDGAIETWSEQPVVITD
ncbi:MAG: glycosyltransferase family 39 protein [Lysobacter sp.]|nr:glycosyltransferase family 39 protein [Lysobacter sp.]